MKNLEKLTNIKILWPERSSKKIPFDFYFKDFFFFLMRTFFKVFVEFVTMLLLFYILTSWPQSCGILVPGAGIELLLPALKIKVLTTIPQGKYLVFLKKKKKKSHACLWPYLILEVKFSYIVGKLVVHHNYYDTIFVKKNTIMVNHLGELVW